MIDISEFAINEPLKIIIGASSQSYPGWIQTQENGLNLLNRDDWVKSFGDRKITYLKK
ncbi:hypothetical protein [Paenibacillus crassostreae]|uniref:hypothetical protein n=1 Tax=Paenibacillus crassostreae TaxID=1763538 RepID=UPI000AFA2327|nr:hypothetical protein [Paenibacillus crassostreae]